VSHGGGAGEGSGHGVSAEGAIRVRSIELREVALPLVRPFRTSFGEERTKDAILVRVEAGGVEGWGECVASPSPRYSEEWNDGAWAVMRDHLGPALFDGEIRDPSDVGRRLSWARGHRMSKAALEAAVLDAWLRSPAGGGRSLVHYLGGVRERVPCGVSVGIAADPDAMLEEIRGYLASGYQRVKLKIEPGRDVEVVRRVHEALGPEVPLSVDANAAYTPADTAVFRALDAFDMVMIEQPLDHDDVADHAALARQIVTPICLDESIRSAHDAVVAIDLGACRIINIKQGRVGGVVEAVRVHDAARERGIPVWIGGMLETGIGRAVNVALAAMPGVTMPGDTSASDRYFAEDLTAPFVVAPDGTMAVPAGPGIGVEPDPRRLDAATARVERVHAP
jgi:O-succinylbenzoate synthase